MLYLVSFGLIIAGVIIYSLWPAPSAMTDEYNSVRSSSNIQTSSADSVREMFHLHGDGVRRTSSDGGNGDNKMEPIVIVRAHVTADGDYACGSALLQPE